LGTVVVATQKVKCGWDWRRGAELILWGGGMSIKADKLLDLNNIRRELARKSYARYVEYVHQGRWIPAKHLIFICDKVQAFLEDNTGHPYDVLILQIPPQHGKSQSITETLPSWFLGKNPLYRVIEVSYNDTFAQKFGRRNREKIKDFGGSLFNIALSKGKDSNEEFELSNNVGGMISRGIMSGVTGNPANLIIIDDPIKNREEADSENNREKQWDEWQNSIKTRLAAGAKVILIMTRWHEDDLAGKVLKSEKNVTLISLPCEAEENDPLGRAVGQALFPEIGKDDEWLVQFKDSFMHDPFIEGGGARAWNALYQQRPSALEGAMIKRQWWKFYTEVPTNFNQILQSWDMTFKDSKASDFVSGQVWGSVGANIYMMPDREYGRMDFPATLAAFRRLTDRNPKAAVKLVEDKANGPAVIAMLNKEIRGIIAINPKGSKIARVSAVSHLIEAGNVYLPSPSICPWINSFIDECASFPNGAHDDQVDCMSQALQRLMYSRNAAPSAPGRDTFLYREETQTSPYTGGVIDLSYINW